jgi:hypothetical protein
VPRFDVEPVETKIREVRVTHRLGVGGKEQPPPLGVIVPNDAPFKGEPEGGGAGLRAGTHHEQRCAWIALQIAGVEG